MHRRAGAERWIGGVQGSGGEAHPHHARHPRGRGDRPGQFDSAHGLQGPPRDRRPRGVPRIESKAGRGAKPMIPSRDLLPRVYKGEIAAIARMLTRAEGAAPEVREVLGGGYAKAGKAHVIGITGVPGSGKSTLVSVLARRLRKLGQKVGIIAIDPSSPY